jgi:hypothetical protein
MARTREEKNAYNREWHAKNKEKRRETSLRWRAKNGARYDAKRREHRAANRERLNAASKQWAAENPDRVAASRALAKIRRERKRLAVHLDWHYDFKLSDYEALLTAQGHRCAICGRAKGNDEGDRLFVDHDHATGAIRGLLCNRCNSALGYFGDSAKRLRRAAAYLENWRGKTVPDSNRVFQPILGCVPEAPSAFRRAQGVGQIVPISNVSGGDLDGAGLAIKTRFVVEG